MKSLVLLLIFFPLNFFLLALSIFLLLLPGEISSGNLPSPKVLGVVISPFPTITFSFPKNDIRVMALRTFFQDYHSPLFSYAELLVKEADLWGLDYRLIPAIAMQESSGCRNIPPESYNCWGYGIYGEKNLKFNSFEEAIEQVAKTIKEKYFREGLTNATLVEDKWAPPSAGQWSAAVNFFLGKISQYEKTLSENPQNLTGL